MVQINILAVKDEKKNLFIKFKTQNLIANIETKILLKHKSFLFNENNYIYAQVLRLAPRR